MKNPPPPVFLNLTSALAPNQAPILLDVPPVNLRRRKARREVGTLDGGTPGDTEVLEVGNERRVAPIGFPPTTLHSTCWPPPEHRLLPKRRDLGRR
ncbi:hypothetical protein LINPERHAP1_LOCUS31790 [Linum perenne]